ncbi:MAG: transaldolase [Acidimicrobiaceae bacterium]|nr:transaldolase [Acidimicrobiaceae bacterium]MCY4279797.1 transaldolase [Acidimicrobiaceae bacterium]
MTDMADMTDDSLLHELYRRCGQSPWLDNIRRGWTTGGELQRWVDRGVRGLTSNPSIFQKAIASSSDYDDEFRRCIGEGLDVESAYWRLVSSDIAAAAAILRGVYDDSQGLDGYVSVEVAPGLAREPDATARAARALHEQLALPNLYVKIPATVEGLAPITAMIAEGISINVTLIFGVERYLEVADAYMSGLEQHPGDLSKVSSVASFFVSRIDTEVDARLTEIATPEALRLRGRAAIANAKIAYGHFCRLLESPRWQALAARGARPQRLLWASTSTKNPSYPDTLYVDELIGGDTVNTLPDATLEAFADHGTVSSTLDAGLDEAAETLRSIAAAGVDLREVTDRLEEEGVAAFSKSFDELLDVLEVKAAELRADGGD